MSKAKRQSTKSLKSKTTRRAAKPVSCPVATIATRQIRLINAMARVRDTKAKHDRNSESYGIYSRNEDVLNDRMVSNRDAASYLTPKTPYGAAFMLLSLYTDAKNMADAQDASDRLFFFRRLERSAYALRRFISKTHGINFRMHWGWYYMHHDDPVDIINERG